MEKQDKILLSEFTLLPSITVEETLRLPLKSLFNLTPPRFPEAV
jgi:hypothetical protein